VQHADQAPRPSRVRAAEVVLIRKVTGRRSRARPTAASAGAIVALLTAGVALGCSEQGGQDTKTVTVHDRPGSAKSADNVAVDPRPQPADAVEYVNDFYGLIDLQRFARAWKVLPESVRSEQASFAAWRDGYGATVKSTPVAVHVTSSSGRSVTVGLGLRSKDRDACTDAAVSQEFAGSWQFVRSGSDWVPRSAQMHKVAGATPETDATNCASAPTTPPEPAVSGACDLNYSGACLDPSASDYDCEGGTGDGPEYSGTVQVVGTDHYGLDSDGDAQGCEP
jgi:hypothetical protein